MPSPDLMSTRVPTQGDGDPAWKRCKHCGSTEGLSAVSTRVKSGVRAFVKWSITRIAHPEEKVQCQVNIPDSSVFHAVSKVSSNCCSLPRCQRHQLPGDRVKSPGLRRTSRPRVVGWKQARQAGLYLHPSPPERHERRVRHLQFLFEEI
jgi:hypothetical protein